MAAERAVDVIVVGGGAMGSAAAWRLARAGHRVRLLEQFAFGHENGSSHGPSRMIRIAYPAPEYVELGQEAFRLWDELQAESGESLLLRTHGMNVGVPHADAMEEVARTLDTLGVPYERLDSDELRRRYTQYTFPEGSIGIYQEDYGILAASRCVAALAARARAEGAQLHDEEPVVGHRSRWRRCDGTHHPQHVSGGPGDPHCRVVVGAAVGSVGDRSPADGAAGAACLLPGERSRGAHAGSIAAPDASLPWHHLTRLGLSDLRP